MGSKDKILLIVAFVSLLFIGLVVVKNYPGKEKGLQMGSYYTSNDTTILGRREGSSYASLTASGRVACPGIDNTNPTGTKVSTTGVTAYANKFGFVYLPFTSETANLNTKSLTKSTLSNAGLKSGSESSAYTVSEHLSGTSPSYPIGDSYYEIIAPFAFSYNNNNLDSATADSDSILITNTKGNLRMIVKNVANWFCAGTYGTETRFSNIDDPVAWEDHDTHHLCKLGSGSNDVTGGSAGDLIGYGSADTTIEFQALTTSGWKTMNISNIILTENK